MAIKPLKEQGPIFLMADELACLQKVANCMVGPGQIKADVLKRLQRFGFVTFDAGIQRWMLSDGGRQALREAHGGGNLHSEDHVRAGMRNPRGRPGTDGLQASRGEK